jgi:hypothetical protein
MLRLCDSDLMRIVISAVSTQSRIRELVGPIAAVAQQLLGRPGVSVIYLIVEQSHATLFEEAVESRDSRLEIMTVAIGPSMLHNYLWHYRQLPGIAARLRADLIHFAYPVPIRRGTLFPGTALSLQHVHAKGPHASRGVLDSLVSPWILRNHHRAMNETSRLSEPLCQQLGLGTTQVSGIPVRKEHPARQRNSRSVTAG